MGYIVSFPFGENSRYDFIVDIDGILLKIQVKTSQGNESVFSFSTRSIHVNCKEVRMIKYSKEEIDYYMTYWDNNYYLIPVKECGTAKKLRLKPPKSNQQNKINYAKDYELCKQISMIKEEVAKSKTS